MADNKTFVLNSINQSRHFDFDSTILANKVINAFMKKWNPIVCNSLIPSIQDFMGGELSEKRLEELKNLWLNRLFQHGKVNVILDKFKKTIDIKVMSIPSNFVLAEDFENSKLRVNEARDEESLLKAVMEKRANILQLRIQIETLKKLQNIRSGV